MAIKYTRPEPDDRRSREPQQGVRMLRYSAAPPTRRALTWIIVGTALVVTLLMVTSQLTSAPPEERDEWVHGTVIPNDSDDPANVLRVELPAEGDEPPHVYDISIGDHPELKSLAPGNGVRIRVETNDAGGIARIIRVKPSRPSSEEE